MGVGRKICEHSVKTDHDLGFAAIVCNRVPGLNPTVMNFLTKCGFVPADEIPHGYRSVKTILFDPAPAASAEQKKLLIRKNFR